MFSPMTAGRKVYSGGSYAPTRGSVAPQGYLKRELKKRSIKKPMRLGPGKDGVVSKVGRDGQSDTRSGLAARILKNTKGSPKPTIAGSKKLNVGGSKKPNIAGQAIPNPAAQVHAQAAAQHANTVANFQPIKISPNGTLELPYDSQSSMALLQEKERMNSELLSLQAQDQETQLALSQARRDNEEAFQNQSRNSLNSSASRGTAFSSQYGNAVVGNNRVYQNSLSDLLGQENSWASTLLNSRNGIQSAFNDFLRKDALDRASRANEQAGSLGYGQDKAKSTLPGNNKNKRKNKGRGKIRGERLPNRKPTTSKYPHTGEQR